MFRSSAWALLVTALASSGCLVRQGRWQRQSVPRGSAPATTSVELILLGDAGADTTAAEATAERVAELLAGPPSTRPIVLWLGNNTHSDRRGTACPSLGQTPGPRNPRLRATISDHVAAGGASFAVAGELEWRCGLLPPGAASEATPFRRPAPQYVVAVGHDGSTRVRWTCTAAGCQDHEPAPDEAPLVELVMADTTPWVDRVDGGEAALRALDHLLERLAEDGAPRPPRILVTHHPVEAAGVHGMGGFDGDATIHTLYPPLREAVLAGAFDGAMAAHDRATYAHRDLSDGIKRSDKMWLHAPLWQVVAGAASLPVARSPRAAPRTRYFTSSAYVPQAYSASTGFAVVRLEPHAVRATLHAKSRAWRTTTMSAPLRGIPHPAETTSPPMAPCLRCEELPPSERP